MPSPLLQTQYTPTPTTATPSRTTDAFCACKRVANLHSNHAESRADDIKRSIKKAHDRRIPDQDQTSTCTDKLFRDRDSNATSVHSDKRHSSTDHCCADSSPQRTITNYFKCTRLDPPTPHGATLRVAPPEAREDI